MERKQQAPTFVDAMTAELGGPRTQAFLERCQRLIDWSALAGAVGDLYGPMSEGGRPPWPVVLMLKCLLLQKWYNLSDPELEEQLRDRISFRRFVGLAMEEGAPDETCFVLFRQRLREAGHAQSLFEATLRQLAAQGLVLRAGTIVDATIIDAPMGRKKADGEHTHDPAATYTKNHGTLRHGYKAHLATTTQGIITDYVFDTAKVHDSRHIDQLTEQETRAVYADSAYGSQERRERHQARGVMHQICQKRVRGQKELTADQKTHNRACSIVRAIVEHPRAWMVKMGYTFARYRGLARNGFDFAMWAIAYNFKRSFSLRGEPLTRPRQRPDKPGIAKLLGLATA
jgi:transposase, IS5 family